MIRRSLYGFPHRCAFRSKGQAPLVLLNEEGYCAILGKSGTRMEMPGCSLRPEGERAYSPREGYALAQALLGCAWATRCRSARAAPRCRPRRAISQWVLGATTFNHRTTRCASGRICIEKISIFKGANSPGRRNAMEKQFLMKAICGLSIMVGGALVPLSSASAADELSDRYLNGYLNDPYSNEGATAIKSVRPRGAEGPIRSDVRSDARRAGR